MRKSILLAVLLILSFSSLGLASEGIILNPKGGTDIVISTVSLYWLGENESMDAVEAWVKVAAERGSHLLILPQLRFAPGEALLPQLSALAKEHRMYIVAAVVEELEEGKCHASYLIAPTGKVAGRYQQTHSLGDEGIILGDELLVFETELGRIAMTCGSDHYFFEVYQVLAAKGADIITWSDYPGLINDYYPFDLKWSVRAFDYQVYIVTAMYAHDKPVVGGNYPSIAGSPWGRSTIYAPSSVPVADTGCNAGVATAFIHPSRGKKPGMHQGNDLGPYRRFGTELMQLHYYGDPSHFHIISDPGYMKPVKRGGERVVRVAVRHGGQMWRPDAKPYELLESIEELIPYKPDLVVLSEQGSPSLDDPLTKEVFQDISQLARRLGANIVIGGISSDGAPSNGYVWDRQGQVIGYASRTWDGKASRAFETFELDFGIIGMKICGDLHQPSIDRALALKGAEIIVDPSQMWGPNGAFNELLARMRSYDNGVWTVCSHWHNSDPSQRSYIIDPLGVPIASSLYQNGDWVVADIVLGKERPRYFPMVENIEVVENAYSMLVFSSSHTRPGQAFDFEEVFWRSRRPELYQPLFGYEKPARP